MAEKQLRFCLAGNPNCGKTTLFNSLTGSTAYVGNWPGVTVEKRSGVYKKKGSKDGVEIIDLPGIYSLSPYTPEEVISRNYILEEKPDLVINVLDATNLERNLYMTTQILEMNVPVVVALNMSDALAENKQSIDEKALSKELGVPVIGISALRKKNLHELMDLAIKTASSKRKGVSLWASKEDEELIEKAMNPYGVEGIADPRFHAIKALEGDEIEKEKNAKAYEEVSSLVNAEEYEADSADKRYKYITSKLAIHRIGGVVQEKKKLSKSDKIDKVLTNRWAALPIMIVLLFLVFHLVFAGDLFYLHAFGVDFGEGYQGLIHWTTGDGEEFYPFAELFYTADGINSPGAILQNFLGAGNDSGIQGMICIGIKDLLTLWGSPEWLIGFVYDGVLNGISSVLGFVPQILLLFTFFSLLEDSGYMARIAFVLDRIFRRFGVSGRAFLPMVMGFGCGVPAMINTRTLSSDKERVKTIRAIPFFTCGAKAEFLVTIAAAVAAATSLDAGLFTFLIYVFGVVVAIAAVIVMNKTTQRENVPPFIMELPAYHAPQAQALALHVWDRGKHYIKKAFTIIFASSVVIWFLSSFTPSWQFIDASETLGVSDSILANIGMILSPLFVPMGFGNVQGGNYGWTFAVASIQGIVAKENVVATLTQLATAVGTETEDSLEGLNAIINAANSTGGNINTASLVAFAVFNMTTIPCFASIGTAKGELAGTGKHATLMTVLFWIVTSYLLGCLTYVTFNYVSWGWSIPVALVVLGGIGLFLWDRHCKAKEAVAA